jgi:outer membrane lipoprotein
VTVVGTVSETRDGKIGEARYVYPVLTATRVHLWPKESAQSSEPRVHFGIGIGIHR